MIRNLLARFDTFIATAKVKYRGFLIFGGYFVDKFANAVRAAGKQAEDELTKLLADGAGYDQAVDTLIAFAKATVHVPFPASLVADMAFDALGRWLKKNKGDLISNVIAVHGPTFDPIVGDGSGI